MEQQSSKSVSPESRRRFITKAAAGSVLLSLPAKSVWANGITNSIVASGHGSDWANGQPLVLQGVNYWMSRLGTAGSQRFEDVFGGRALVGVESSTTSSGFHDRRHTIFQIMNLQNRNGNTNSNTPNRAGPQNYNRLLIAMYMNALHGANSVDVHYPVANGRPFADAQSYAHHLYSITSATPSASAQALASLISNPSGFVV